MPRHHRRHRKSSKNMFNKTVSKGVSVAKSTSRKYMPKVKSGLENVGSNVVSTSQKSIPFLQKMTRKLFSVFGRKSRRHRRH